MHVSRFQNEIRTYNAKFLRDPYRCGNGGLKKEANFCSQQIGAGTRRTHFRTTNTYKTPSPPSGWPYHWYKYTLSLNLPYQILFTFLFSSCFRQVTMQLFCVCHKKSNRCPWSIFHVYHTERKKEREKREMKEKREERIYIKGTSISLEKR